MDLVTLHKWLEERLDAVQADLTQIKIVQAEQAKDITHHIKRSDLLEAWVQDIQNDVKPLETHVAYVRGGLKLLGLVGLLVGIVAGLAKLFTA